MGDADERRREENRDGVKAMETNLTKESLARKMELIKDLAQQRALKRTQETRGVEW